MDYPNSLFAFTCPTRFYEKSLHLALWDFCGASVDSTGLITYWRGKLPHDLHSLPTTKPSTLQMDPLNFAALKNLLSQDEPLLKAYFTRVPYCIEAKKLRHTTVHCFGLAGLVPDYVMDYEDKTYLPRYICYPDHETQKAYAAVRELGHIVALALKQAGIPFPMAVHPLV